MKFLDLFKATYSPTCAAVSSNALTGLSAQHNVEVYAFQTKLQALFRFLNITSQSCVQNQLELQLALLTPYTSVDKCCGVCCCSVCSCPETTSSLLLNRCSLLQQSV
jgi:hypothetical protein